MTEFDVIPLGTTVCLNSDLSSSSDMCQVIGIHVNKRTGQVLYELGHITQRRWPLRFWPKKHKMHHMVRGHLLDVLPHHGSASR